MPLSKDWREFLELLNSRGVDYVIIGAQSLAFHGRPRYTGDLEILVRSTPENARILVDLLNQFGFARSGFGGVPVFILVRDALVRNKRAVGRPQDLADLETLES